MPTTASSEPVPPAVVEPFDLVTMRASITRALAPGPLPRFEELEELAQLLRGHIVLLLPDAEAAVDALPRASVDWYDRAARLDGVRATLHRGLGDGLTSARVHVATLARDCQALLQYAGAKR